MLVYRFTIATTTCMAALLVGCTDPDLPTDLRRNGPPNVTTVTVMSDLADQLVETATYCRVNDEKRPGLVGLPTTSTLQVCPADLAKPAEFENVAEAAPSQWWVRIVFDRLLDPSIEDLEPGVNAQGMSVINGTLKNTQPVILKCNDTVLAYDGYYVPDGNRNSWPLGPALFIQPAAPQNVSTGAPCSVTLKDNVHSKSGESVPPDQRSYQFKTAPMAMLRSVPDPSESDGGALLLDLTQPVELFFTAALDTIKIDGGAIQVSKSSLDPAKVQLSSKNNNPDGSANAAVCSGGGDPVSSAQIRMLVGGKDGMDLLALQIDAKGSLDAASKMLWKPSTTYRLRLAPGTSITAKQGGEVRFPDGFELCFHTPANAHP